MVNNAETTARTSEADTHNDPGYCLQQTRTWAEIGSLYGDAATAWAHTKDRRPGDRNPPRGAAVYWTGGSSGYGHIATAVGGGNVRSTDANGKGKVGTVDLGWFERNWGLKYAGWAWDINGVTIPHDTGEEDEDMDLNQEITLWSPDEGGEGKTTVGKTLNQARGYSEDAYDRIKALQNDVAAIKKALGIK
jgi:hypothetical protein